ncbi:lysophospholipid acyltransferase family protein [Chitinophaga solisilvae]|uniref:lysophospholipid acyltransferase family protein n=1 Tax=Chitinophaga solisilvae TaxID=1233460 RepID=UPI00136CDDCC|nr:lysophospholipid acyltransferase family protein [Chitinophaga solisilvae]
MKYQNGIYTEETAQKSGVAWIFYFLLYRVMRYRYAEVIQNLSRSFPEKSYGEIKNIATQFYRHFSRLFMEILELFTIPESRIKKRVVLHQAALLDACHARGRNIIIMLGHYGNWECVTMLPAFFSFDIYGVYKPLHNGFFNRLMKKIRGRFGLKMLPVEEAPKHLLKSRKPGAYIFISDQSPAKGGKYIVNFLNQPTRVITGAERLARATDAVVVYAVINRSATGRRWEITFSLITDDAATTRSGEITSRFNQQLEQDIRKSPAYWLWTHRRWKTQV